MPDVRFSGAPFSLPNPLHGRPLAGLATVGVRAAEHLLGLARLNRLYRIWAARPEPFEAFPDRALEILQAGYDVEPEALRHVPATGAVIVVSNHPHGALDGLVLASLLRRRRRDVRLMGNYLLARIPEVQPLCIFVDPFGDRAATRRNASGLREAVRWVEGGGLLVVFPAGEVSHAPALGAPVTDPMWSPSVARLAEQTRAAVVPIHIGGSNRAMFQAAGLLHARLRTLLLARELLAQRGRRVGVHIGTPVSWATLSRLRSAEARAFYLRVRTYGLPPAPTPAIGGRRLAAGATGPAVVRPPLSCHQLAADIAARDPGRVLVRSGGFSVICARARELPSVLLEIGRLRELTFRSEGEGTGRACDLDRYDAAYWHLFVWNGDRQEIAGAYRLGPTDDLGALQRPQRLYTRSLFRFGRPLLARLGPALELGRSFVRERYQRDYGTLMLLWKGIGQFVARASRYRMLFGPVSLSPRYRPASHEWLVATLSGPRYRSSLASLVSSKRPPSRLGAPAFRPPVIELPLTDPDAHQLLVEIEGGNRGVPVLLRQYLKLNAKVLAFSIDPAFGRTLDGLMVVDLLDVDRAILQRYLGKDGAAGFLAHHRAAVPAAAEAQPAIASA